MNKTMMAIAVALSQTSIVLWGCGGREEHLGDEAEAGAGNETDSGGGTGGHGDGTGLSTSGTTGGGANASNTEPIVTSVPGDAVLSELSPEEATVVCEETSAAADPSSESRQRLLCTLLGLIDGAAAANPVTTCEASVATCVAAASSSSTDPDCSGAADALAECDATVDEVNQCLSSLTALEEQYGETLDCTTTESIGTLALLASTQAGSCITLEASCPGFTG